eukprot:TRINITY_DN58027_c0_g1_i1.p1 TRINITY_DN58027_c0_g1~~TRINITY_DN58027_c0_g1_i1.p1  ORF type:complete len:434 (+),score=61.67 TRINITY_DN58027_c0_g1_i1:41-1303(+)
MATEASPLHSPRVQRPPVLGWMLSETAGRNSRCWLNAVSERYVWEIDFSPEQRRTRLSTAFAAEIRSFSRDMLLGQPALSWWRILNAQLAYGGAFSPARMAVLLGFAGAAVVAECKRRHLSAANSSNCGLRPMSSNRVNFLAGLVAGLAVDVPLHPLDTIKTRLQAHGHKGFAASGGVSSLWKGIGPVLLRSLPCTALFFTTYEQSRQRLGSMQGLQARRAPLPWYIDAAAGGLANGVACTVRVPCEVLKQQMQMQVGPGKGQTTMISVAGRLLEAGGLSNLFRGFGATASRELAFALVQMPIFEELKRLHPQSSHSKERGSSAAAVGMACGGIAGAVAGAVTNPLDVAKTQIMLGSRSPAPSVLQQLRWIIARDGPAALWRGVGARTAYVGASCSLSFGAFEWAKCSLVNEGRHLSPTP